jgi:hypothetical protein
MVVVVMDVGIVILGIIIIVIVGVLVANKGWGNPDSCACTQTNSCTALRKKQTICLFSLGWYRTSFFFFLVVLRFELRALYLLGTLSLEPCLHPFLLGYFGDRVSLLPRPVWTMMFLFYDSCHSWGDRYTHLFSVEMGSCNFFLLKLTWNCNASDLSLPSS